MNEDKKPKKSSCLAVLFLATILKISQRFHMFDRSNIKRRTSFVFPSVTQRISWLGSSSLHLLWPRGRCGVPPITCSSLSHILLHFFFLQDSHFSHGRLDKVNEKRVSWYILEDQNNFWGNLHQLRVSGDLFGRVLGEIYRFYVPQSLCKLYQIPQKNLGMVIPPLFLGCKDLESAYIHKTFQPESPISGFLLEKRAIKRSIRCRLFYYIARISISLVLALHTLFIVPVNTKKCFHFYRVFLTKKNHKICLNHNYVSLMSKAIK